MNKLNLVLNLFSMFSTHKVKAETAKTIFRFQSKDEKLAIAKAEAKRNKRYARNLLWYPDQVIGFTK